MQAKASQNLSRLESMGPTNYFCTLISTPQRFSGLLCSFAFFSGFKRLVLIPHSFAPTSHLALLSTHKLSVLSLFPILLASWIMPHCSLCLGKPIPLYIASFFSSSGSFQKTDFFQKVYISLITTTSPILCYLLANDCFRSPTPSHFV